EDRGSIAEAIDTGQTDAVRFRGRTVDISHAIVSDGEHLGTVHLAYSLNDLFVDLARYVGIAFLVLVVSVVAAVVAASRVQRSFSQPIERLAKAAGAVSREKDYAVRVEPTESRDELGVLMNTFNEMLARIQARDAEVQAGNERFQKLNEELEERVLRRT